MRNRRIAAIDRTLRRLDGLFNHDRDQSLRLLAFAVGGLIMIGLWGLYGDLVLANIIVVAVTEVLILVYAFVLALRMEQLVRAQDRWQVDSALTFRQMLAEAKTMSGDIQAGSPFYARRLRLQLNHEMRRCTDFGTPFTLMVMRLELPGQAPSHALFVQANTEVAELAAQNEETLVAATALGFYEYGFLLRNCDRTEAVSISRYLQRALSRYSCSFGYAVYPRDGDSIDPLLRLALEGCGVLRDSTALAGEAAAVRQLRTAT